jgi:hypothetical protein
MRGWVGSRHLEEGKIHSPCQESNRTPNHQHLSSPLWHQSFLEQPIGVEKNKGIEIKSRRILILYYFIPFLQCNSTIWGNYTTILITCTPGYIEWSGSTQHTKYLYFLIHLLRNIAVDIHWKHIFYFHINTLYLVFL